MVAAARGKPIAVVANPLAAAKAAGARWKARGTDAGRTGRYVQLGAGADGTMGIPLRDLLQALYKRKRDKIMVEGVVYLLWVLCFLVLVYALFNVQDSNTTNAALRTAFVEQDFPSSSWGKTWREVNDPSEFWEFVDGVLLEGLYIESAWSGTPLPPDRLGYVFGNGGLMLVGAVELRQFRVRNDSCVASAHAGSCSDGPGAGNTTEACAQRFGNTDGTCFADFSAAAEERQPWGPPDDPHRYTWSGGHSRVDGFYGWGPKYGTGGYAVLLPHTNATAAAALSRQLQDDDWVDRATRGIAVTFNTYSTTTGLASVVRMMYELTPAGYGMSSQLLLTFPVDPYGTIWANIMLALQLVYLLFVLFWTQKVVKGAWWSRPKIKYLASFNNVCDVLLVALNGVMLARWLRFFLDPVSLTFSVRPTGFVELYAVAVAFQDIVTVAGFIGVVGAIKLFKYLALQKRMSLIWLTLGKAAPELAAFTLALFIVVFGYGFLSHMLFGAYLPAFHSYEECIASLLRMAVGDFDYATLARERPSVVGIFFGTYITLVYLICLNIVIAIISEFYTDVHEELLTGDRWKLSVVTIDSYLAQRIALLLRLNCGCCSRVSEYTRALCRNRAMGPPCGCCSRRGGGGSSSGRSSVGTGATAGRRTTGTGGKAAAESKSTTSTFTSAAGWSARRQTLTRARPVADPSAASDEDGAGAAVNMRNPMLAAGRSTSDGENGVDSESGGVVPRRSGAAKLAAVFDLADGAAMEAAAHEAQRARKLQADRTQLEVWKHESLFMSASAALTRLGKRRKGFDLYTYLDALAEEPGWDRYFIGLHELCVLCNPTPCEPGSHTKCAARRVIDTFQAIKSVTVTGGVMGAFRHVPRSSYVNSAGYRRYEVLKCNVSGRSQSRVLLVDSESAALVNFDMHGRVRKKLPLVHLLQLERYEDDHARLSLVFSSTGEHVRRLPHTVALDKLLETQYQLLFKDQRERDDFVAEVLAVMERMPTILSTPAHAADEGAGDGRSGDDGSGGGADDGGIGVGRGQRRASVTSQLLDAAREEYAAKKGGAATSAQLLALIQAQSAAIAELQAGQAALLAALGGGGGGGGTGGAGGSGGAGGRGGASLRPHPAVRR